jgi:hypothetical protein
MFIIKSHLSEVSQHTSNKILVGAFYHFIYGIME